MFVAVSTRCFSDKPLEEACLHLAELEYDKVELWFDDRSSHLRPAEVTADPERFFNRFREFTRLVPIAFCLEHDIPGPSFLALCKLAKLFRLTQITVPASPLGTPFNAEIDRLRELHRVGSEEGVRVSIKTRTGHLTEDPRTAVELCQAVPGLGLTLDPSHYICGPHHGENYDAVIPYVYHVHLRDTQPNTLQVPVGLGEIEYSRLIHQLERVRYQRALSVEMYPELLDLAQRAIELRKLRLLLESLL